MTYSKNDLAVDVSAWLDGQYDPAKIAKHAHALLLDCGREFGPGVRGLVMQLIAMEEGEQFVMTESEVRSLVM